MRIAATELASSLSGFLGDKRSEMSTAESVPSEISRYSPLTAIPRGFRGRSICFSHVGNGPLSVRSQSAFQSLRLGILPRTPSTLARGGHQLRLGATWANQWANDDAVFDPAEGRYGHCLLDCESLDAAPTFAWGASDAIQLEAEYEQRWRFEPRMSLILQVLSTQGVARDSGPFSRTSNEVVFGCKWEVRRAGVLEIGILENILTFGNSPDFGVHAALTQRF